MGKPDVIMGQRPDKEDLAHFQRVVDVGM